MAEAVRLQPAFRARALLVTAHAHADVGRREDAERLVGQVRASGPLGAGEQLELGRLLRALDRWAEAEEAYRAALAIRPVFAEADNNLGFLLAVMGRFDEAAEHFESALRCDSEPGPI